MKSFGAGLASLCLLALLAWRSSVTHRLARLLDEPTGLRPSKHTSLTRVERASPSALATSRRELRVENAIALMEVETDADRRCENLDQTVASFALNELPAVLDSLKDDARPAMMELSRLFLSRWAESDPVASAEWAMRLPEGEARRSMLERVAVAWAGTDIDSATAWVRGLPEGENRNSASLSLAYEAARTDPLLALELACVLPPTCERDESIVHAVSQWTATDSAAATSWVTMIPVPALRQRLLAAVAIGDAERDGANSADLVARSLNGTDELNRTVTAVVQRWTQTAPSAAAAWISQFPESAVRDVAAQTLIKFWAPQDPQASGLWVRDLPGGSLRDIALEAYVPALSNRNGTDESTFNLPESPNQPESSNPSP